VNEQHCYNVAETKRNIFFCLQHKCANYPPAIYVLDRFKKEMLFIHAFELHVFMNFLTNCCEGLWLNNKEPVLFRLPSG